ncbi:MAG TPA: ATP-dependent Clp protease ATP-binding subunit [Patescibacteria group bacterium]|nr:ATP-dependent Clp protease ATP-binding subunit [Patescibacteria group bacterium]
MRFEQNPPLGLLICETCKGTGYDGVRRCRRCRGMGVGRFAEKDFWYWGEPQTHYHFSLQRGRRVLNKVRISGGLVFGLGFLFLFLYGVYQQGLGEKFFTLDFWQGNVSPLPFLFWLSILSFSYLFYRLLVSEQSVVPLWTWEKDKKTMESKEIVEREEGMATWDQMVRLRARNRHDISQCFTAETKEVLEQAYRLAHRQHNPEITAAHIFHVLLSVSKVEQVFGRLGLSAQLLQAKLAQGFVAGKEGYWPGVSEEVRQILFQAFSLAKRERQEVVHVTELLLAAVYQSEPVQEMLYDFEVDKDKLVNVVSWLRIRERMRRQFQKYARAAARRSKYGLDRAMTAVATPYLNSFSQDLTMMAKYHNLAPCVARDKEIDEIFRLIDGGHQGIVLVGERGVGKMTIIEGIAQKMVEEVVPKRLQDKRLVQLSTSSLLAGTTVSGAQERLLRIMSEVAKAKNVILFVKNVHDLISISGQEGSEGLDVSETFSEFLNRGQFLTLSTSTLEGYNRHIMNSEIGSNLARVDIKEMDVNQTIQVLESKVGATEYHQRVFFSYDALERAVNFAKKFLSEQRLPDSAVSLMTETAAFVHQKKGENSFVRGEDVAAVISEKSGVPVASITESESEKLLRLEEEMHKRVVGQDEAVSLIANALRRARAEVRSQARPIANFLFLGPTGVGKTELAKTIASVYFGGEDRMVRVDMSEYQDKAAVYRLIGQPNQQGTGLLTEAVRQHPFSLVLLDEMEKADPDVLNLFLQVFDDGRLTDSVGKVIDFTNTIIIATSNAGTNYVQEQIQAGRALEDIRQEIVRGELKKYYRPEFLNRFDGIVLFRALNREEIKKIAGLMLKQVEKNLEERGVELRISAGALDTLGQVGFDPEFGARPMRRAIQDRVENQLARLILENALRRRDVLFLDPDLSFRVERDPNK